MDPNKFAETIKAKYPQYKNVDNLTLAKKMVEKYPTYASKVNFNTKSQVTPQNVIQSLAKKTLPGASTAVIPALPAGATKTGLADTTKIIPNALGDIWNLVKEATYGTAKKIVYDIPKEAIGLVKDQGIVGAVKSYTKSIPSAVKEVTTGLIPQSAKEITNINAIAEIPDQFKQLVKQSNGSYTKAFLSAIKAIPGALPDAAQNYLDQIDRARQSVVNHPVNEFLGYMGLKSLGNIKTKTAVGALDKKPITIPAKIPNTISCNQLCCFVP